MEGSQARGSQARGWGYPEHDGYGGGGGWRMQADRESGLRANVGIAHGPGGSSRCVCVYVYVYVCMCVCVCEVRASIIHGEHAAREHRDSQRRSSISF